MLNIRLFSGQSKSGKTKSEKAKRPRHAILATPGAGVRMVQEKVDVANLKIGLYVVALDIPWEDSDFIFQGFRIKSLDEIAALQRQCSHVFVELDKSVSANRSRAADGAPRPRARPHFDTRPVEEEIDEATQIHSMANQTISDVFRSVRLGSDIDGGALKLAVQGCVESIVRNADASIWLTQLRIKSEATAQHSLNVAALSVILGKTLNYSFDQLVDIGVCASLHDIGKTRLSDQLVNASGKLSTAELETMKLHTAHGRDILISSKTVMSGAADVAYCHHERPDGQGYPRGLTEDSIPYVASMVAIAEAYDSMTTEQKWRPALSPSDALRVLYAERGRQFDDELVVQFIEGIGIFPPGSIVEMEGGEIGIVLANTKDRLLPRVILVLDANKQPMRQRVIDLSRTTKESLGYPGQIRTTHHNGSFGIDIEEFKRGGLQVG